MTSLKIGNLNSSSISFARLVLGIQERANIGNQKMIHMRARPTFRIHQTADLPELPHDERNFMELESDIGGQEVQNGMGGMKFENLRESK